MPTRCSWAEENERMIEYHDSEWCAPSHDDSKLFEFLVLQTFQAGLSWNIILQKRENFQQAFDDFNYKKIATYGQKKVKELMDDETIVRNKLKIESTVNNAKAFLKIREEFGTFNEYIWKFVDFEPIQNEWENLEELPSNTKLSEKISKDMKKRGFKFVGSTIIYSYMQSIGMVNDHVKSCFRYAELKD